MNLKIFNYPYFGFKTFTENINFAINFNLKVINKLIDIIAFVIIISNFNSSNNFKASIN